MTGFTRVAVVIPTLNEGSTIRDVVSSLLSPAVAGLDLTLIIADGGSSDDTRAQAKALAEADPRIRLIENPRRIQSAAVNIAAREVRGNADVLVRCDAHARYPADFVTRVVQTLEETGADSVVVPMDSIGRSCTGRAIAWVADTPVGSGGSAHRGGRQNGWIDHGHHAGWRLESFLANGGYDEGFSHNEDAEFDCRLRARGGRIWLTADARLGYFVRSTLAELWKQYRAYGHGRSRTVRRHPGSMRMRQLAVPSFMMLNLAALFVAPWLPWALLLPACYAAILLFTSLAGARAIGACGLRAGPAAFVQHAAWALGFVSGWLGVREARWQPAGPAAPFPSPEAAK